MSQSCVSSFNMATCQNAVFSGILAIEGNILKVLDFIRKQTQ